METTFLYVLTDPTTGAVRYLGKSDNPFKRFKSHLRDSTPSHKKSWINSLKSRGLVPHMDLLDEVPVSQWQFWEREYIRVFRAIGIPLVNQCDGGENPPSSLGKTPSPETCANISAALKGKKHSAERCAKQSERQTGVKHSAEHCANIGAAQRGKKRSAETCANISAGKLGKKYSAEHRANIGAVQKGKKRSAECRANMSAAMFSRHQFRRMPWFTNGEGI